MKAVRLLLAMAAAVLATTTANAQFVKGNEAVRVMADGSSKVEVAPLPSSGPIRTSKPCAASGNCHGGAWLMVETPEGLRECTEAYARPGTCRASSYGSTKLLRLWVVKSGGRWMQCQLPSLGSKCVELFAPPPNNLPFPAVQ